MATNQRRQSPIIGFLTPATATPATATSLNTASGAGWMAYSFIPSKSKTLNAIRIWQDAPGGTPALVGGTCDLFSDTDTGASAGVPSASVEGPKTIAIGSWPSAAAAAVEFTGFTTALTAGTRYWAVYKNISVLTTQDYPKLRSSYAGSSGILTASATWGWAVKVTTDSGATWSAGATSISGIRLQYSDGSYEGMPIIANDVYTSTNMVYNTRERGVAFTTPVNELIKVKGISMPVYRLGSAQGNLRYRLYTGTAAAPTLVGTTAVVQRDKLATLSINWFTALFTSPISIGAGTELRVVAGEDGAGDVSNAYKQMVITIENDANSKALLPFVFGQVKTTFTTNSGTSFTDDDTTLTPFALILDSDESVGTTSFVAGGGSSGGGAASGFVGRYQLKKATTSKRLAVFIADSTTGAGKTGLVYNSSGLKCYYWREDEANAAATAVTLVTATRGTFTSSGFIEKDATNDPGWYEFGIPNAALATGATWVRVQFQGVSGTLPSNIEIALEDYLFSDMASTTQNAAAVWDEARSGHVVAGSFGEGIRSVQNQITIQKNTAFSNYQFFMRQDADPYAGATGLTFSAAQVVKDNGTFASLTNSGSITEIANGFYRINLAAGDVNATIFTLLFAATGAKTTRITHTTQVL